MAIESAYWREEMRRDIAWLRKRRTFGRWSEKQMVLYERRLILVAAQIRVLLDQYKVPPELAEARVTCMSYPKMGGRPTTRMDGGRLYKRVDAEAGSADSLGIRDLCNQLLHHYEISAYGPPKEYTHLVVFSDYMRNRQLYEIEIPTLLDFFGQYAHPEAGWYGGMRWTWNEKRQDYDVTPVDSGDSPD